MSRIGHNKIAESLRDALCHLHQDRIYDYSSGGCEAENLPTVIRNFLDFKSAHVQSANLEYGRRVKDLEDEVVALKRAAIDGDLQERIDAAQAALRGDWAKVSDMVE